MQTSLTEPPPQCADCGAEEPSWASLNRGVLVCTDCCYIHRNLGRYISQIKSLKKSHWEASQLELIKLLHRSGSNRIWEHSLTQPQFINTIKKPIASDPVFPAKESFIKAKYVDQLFTIKQSKDDDPWNIEDLNRQLWSCVRASHVDTTLRLLVLGADPNYCDPDKQNSPLHVAAKEGQPLQVELLIIYGANPSLRNAAGNTPGQVARLENNNSLANRLDELRFEISNRLTWFLTGRKPEHNRGQHFLIPDLVGKDGVELKAMKYSLQALPNAQFEKIAQDVYDEVDRRETVAAWEAMREKEAKHLANEQCVAVFLPLNPSMPAMRNQQRQKLAKYSTRQFACLIIDILKEAKRRYLGLDPAPEETDSMDMIDGVRKMDVSMQEYNGNNRDYDDVADYKLRISTGTRGSSSGGTGGRPPRSSGASINHEPDERAFDDVLELKERVSDCENSINHLMNTNSTLNKKLSSMHATLERYAVDNVVLRDEVARLTDLLSNSAIVKRLPSPGLPSGPSMSMSASTASINNNGERKMSRPSLLDTSLEARLNKRNATLTSPIPSLSKLLPPSGRTSVDHIREREEELSRELEHDIRPMRIEHVFTEAGFPDNLIRETECLTTAIRQLLSDAQRGMLSSVAEKHAYNIGSLISHIIRLIPPELRCDAINGSVSALTDATAILSAKCNNPHLDSEETCHAAYNVAKAAKSLLMAVHD